MTIPPVGQTDPVPFLVTNTGNVTMTGIAVTDPTTTGMTCPVDDARPGHLRRRAPASHTVTQADIDAGAVVNTATVTGTPPIGPPIPPVTSNQVTILASQLPALTLVKSSTAVTIPPVGQTIPYQFAGDQHRQRHAHRRHGQRPQHTDGVLPGDDARSDRLDDLHRRATPSPRPTSTPAP